jgi:glycosyltransferase involved in cell wall biosynthesis
VKTLLATNPAYWPSIGGSEMVLAKILEGSRDLFDRIVVFAPRENEEIQEHNGIEIRSYSRDALRKFAKQERPELYFPNMVHSSLTYENISKVSRYSRRTVVNMIGGYSPETLLAERAQYLEKVRRFADVAVHVDELSTEYFIDRAIEPGINFTFITQGLDFPELTSHQKKGDGGYFLYAHNLWHWKCPERFIEEIVAFRPDLEFKIIASSHTGDRIREVTKLAKKHKNLKLHLGLDRSSFLDILSGAIAVVSTSDIEGAQPNILLETGFLGVPYLSLPPGQNFGHYPHVEMFASVEELRERLHKKLRTEKRAELGMATRHFASSKYRWESVIEEFRSLFLLDQT